MVIRLAAQFDRFQVGLRNAGVCLVAADRYNARCVGAVPGWNLPRLEGLLLDLKLSRPLRLRRLPATPGV